MFEKIVCPATDEFPRNSEGDIIELKDGSLLLAWSEFYGGHGDGQPAQISAKRSTDGGQTWGEKFILQENVGDCNVMSVSFLRSQSGDILFFYLVKNSWMDLKVMMRRSQDEGKTWSEPVQVSSKPGYNVMNNARVIQLKSGRLLAPVAHSARASSEDISTVFCYISDDDGCSWRKGRGETGFEEALSQEPGLIERKDGSVLMIIRTALDYICYAESKDGGETWGKPYPSTLVSPLSPASIARIPKRNDLVIIWNNNPNGGRAGWNERTPLTAAISKDDGVTWGNLKNIESDPNYCYAYTSITFIGDQTFLTYYYWKKSAIDHFAGTALKLKVLPTEWFYY